jgi:hypothetical protein
MEREKREAPIAWEVARARFNRDGKNVLIDPTFRAIRDERGKLRFVITIPNADQIVFPDDLGVLLQCFGWGMASLGYELKEDS